MEPLLAKIDNSRGLSQLIPLALTFVVMAAFLVLLHGAIMIFNLVPSSEKIILQIRWYDVLVGGTIYLKTSIDFAIFIGRMMAANPGWRNRIAIEIGTAAGNAIGTIAIIGLWVLLKDIDILLAAMVLLASLVLFELAHGSLEHFKTLRGPYVLLRGFLDFVKRFTNPVLSRILPDMGAARGSKNLPWWGLLGFSMSVPFVLGLDDFAGYVPLFNVVNVYGFAIGVITSHTILNIALFLSPRKTIMAVKNEWVSFLGALAFIGLALYGFVEAGKIIRHLF